MGAEDGTEFNFLEQETVTNTSSTRFTVTNLQPYTVYTFRVRAINTVGRSETGKQSYPAVTLMESKYKRAFGEAILAEVRLILPHWSPFLCPDEAD